MFANYEAARQDPYSRTGPARAESGRAVNTSRTLLVTLLGAFARRTGDWMPIGGIVALLEQLGADESGVRTSVSRLKHRDWLAPEKRDGRSGYRLTPQAKEALSAGDRVIWHAREPADLGAGWCIASFSVPEKKRDRRYLLRSRLIALGFGNVGPGVWIAPARMRADALELIDRLGLRDHTTVFVGSHEGGQDLQHMVSTSWNVEEIHRRYAEFVATHLPDLDALVEEQDPPPREAFVRYMLALDDWRDLPLRDPGLPRELLPADWAGDAAGDLLEHIVARLDGPALAHVRAALASP